MNFFRKILSSHRPRIQPYKVPGTLEGIFKFAHGTISGEVRDKHNIKASEVTVSITRFGEEILSSTAKRIDKSDRYRFEIPINSAFSPAEFVSEKAEVLARNAIGATGKLRLDGTSGIELVREYFGLPTTTICDINFLASGNSREYIGEGWYGPGKDYTFTEGTESIVKLPTLKEDGKYALRLLTGAVTYGQFHPSQFIQIFLNDELIWSERMTDGYTQFFEIGFNVESYLNKELKLRINHPDVVRPCDQSQNTNDSRLLALTVRRLTLVRFLAPGT